MKIKSVKQLKKLTAKTVFLRVDFNVPLQQGKITDDYKISAGLETIKFLLARGARLVIATHLGEPSGKAAKQFSTKPVAEQLARLLKIPVKFIPAVVGSKARQAVERLKPGEIIFLENLRFESGELNNDPGFAQELAALADLYVNDAFAVSHREQASVAAVKKYLPSYAGLLLVKEIEAAQKILKPRKPLVVIMGGAKISTKVPLIFKLYRSASQILLGGALANNFFKGQKLEIGRSLYDADSLIYFKKIKKEKKLAAKIILPLDVIVKNKRGAQLRKPNEVKKDEFIFDIGPATISLYAQYIKKAATLVWNGPMGKFEEASFKYGTLSIARLVASRSQGPAYGLVGGGETIAALKLTKMTEYVDWVSTAGGAMLTYLGGAKMPGLKGIIK
jgi:phosphoglycerate kinase